MAVLNKFGSSAGSGVEADLIASNQVGTATASNTATITDWGATARATSADSIILLQKSNNNVDWTEVDRIEMPTGGTILKTFESPIKVNNLQYFRVRFSQGTPGTISGQIFGETSGADILDI
jgi:hypothetical protein